MTEALIALVPRYGLLVVGLVTFLSCLALPVPSALVMLAAGGFSASGDLALAEVLAVAWIGAVAGDQAGFLIGRWGGAPLLARLRARGRTAALVARAEAMVAARGGIAVFLSRWLVSALGPYVNLLTGAAGLSPLRFLIAGASGEAVWVGIYVGLGYLFADRIPALADLLGSLGGLIAAGVVAGVLGAWLLRALRAAPARRG